MAKRSAPEVNAGSMADIAFLLLIFFLVTTTIPKDSGINRKLPPMEPPNEDQVVIKQKNIFTVLLNGNDQILVEDELMELKDLRKAAIAFLDNGGATDAQGNRCDYCNGKRDASSSDHPNKAVISVETDRATSYGMYITVQNELLGAYSVLRDRYANNKFGMSFVEMEKIYKADRKNTELKKKIDEIKEAYPQIISDVEQ